MFKVFYFPEVAKYVENLNVEDNSRLNRTRKLFEEKGFVIGQKYIKKITRSGIWELRAGKIRLLLYIKGNTAVGVHIIHKKSQKLPLKDIRLAERRSIEI